MPPPHGIRVVLQDGSETHQRRLRHHAHTSTIDPRLGVLRGLLQTIFADARWSQGDTHRNRKVIAVGADTT
jgi:hypothetical protein